MAGRIVPSQCKQVKPGRVRVELKLKKAEPLQWTDYEVHIIYFMYASHLVNTKSYVILH